MDGINMLPDELLVVILSHLTVKEAAATSILSRRWRYLWTFTDKLDFDDTESFLKLKSIYRKTIFMNTELLEEEISKYVKWVNHVIASRNNSSPVHDFKVVFYLNKSHEQQILEWIRYALEREVQTLELNLSDQGFFLPMYEQFCTFPYKILQKGIHLKQLRRISLKCVNVGGEALEFLLCICPLLEGLSVCESRTLVTLRVIGPFPSLKLLEISWCNNLESVEIRDVNLVSLKYYGSWRDVKFAVENAPLLVELFVGGGIINLECFLAQLWTIHDQLEMLSIEIHSRATNPPKFMNLKHLVVEYNVASLLPLINLISAAPRLEKFVLKVLKTLSKERVENIEKKNLYGKLKEIVFVEYRGGAWELELVKHLVKNAAALQKITIHCRIVTKAKEFMDAGEKSKKRRKEESWIMDGMSMLPDELLVMILSHLTVKEAAATSILSRRWRYLWTFTDKLDFDGMSKSLLKLNPINRNTELLKLSPILDEERSNYMKWVNHVIASRNDAVPIHDFKVSFYMKKSHEEQIHEWIRYALERKAQTLELNLSRRGCRAWHEQFNPLIYRIWQRDDQFCSFPYRFLQQGSCSFNQLRGISLEAVDVSGEALEFLLRNCPLLEGLSVCGSRELVTLRVIGPLPSLKLLEISSCDNMKSVEIRDVNLVSLKYSGSWKDVKFAVENAPLLVEIFVGGEIRYLERFIAQFWRILEILSIEIHGPAHKWQWQWQGINLPKFRNLKKLVVTDLPDHVDSLLPLTNLIAAAPHLQKFVFKAKVLGNVGEGGIENMEKKNLYEKLKEVEFVGYRGVACELELVMHLVENAAALKKITIHPSKFYCYPYPNLICDGYIKARACAHQLLRDQVPHPIILDIL